MVFIVIAVGVRGPGVEESLKGDADERWTFVRSGFFEAIGVISFAFVVSSFLHSSLVSCLAELTRSNEQCHHNSRSSSLLLFPSPATSLADLPLPLNPSTHLRLPPRAHSRPIRASDPRLHSTIRRRLLVHVYERVPRLH